MTALLSHILIPVSRNNLQNISVSDILTLRVKTLAADYKYSLLVIVRICRNNFWNLQELYQMQLSKMLKPFCQFFSPFFKSASHFQYFEKKMTLPACLFSKLQTAKDMVRRMS